MKNIVTGILRTARITRTFRQDVDDARKVKDFLKVIHTNNTTLAALATFAALAALVSTSYVYAKVPNIPPPQLPPGFVVIPPSQQHGPPLAQIQSDIAKHQQQAQAMIDLFTQRLGSDTSTAHAAQVLKQMTAEGKINCPAPFANPGHCFLTPKPAGVAPPIG